MSARLLNLPTRFALSCILCATLILGALPAFPTLAYATNKKAQTHLDKASSARKQAAAADQKAADLQKQIKDLDAQAEKYADQAQSLDPKISSASSKAQELLGELSALQKKEAALRSDIASTTAEFQVQQKQLAARVVDSYKNGDQYVLELLFGSEDMNDFITRTEIIGRLMRSNSEASQQLNLTKRKLESDKVQLDNVVSEAQKKSDAAVANAQELKAMQDSRKNAAAASEALQNQKTALMKDTKKNAARLRALADEEEAEAAKISSELAGNGSGQFSGSMTWPVPASHRITSPFGWRICPYHGRELHPGIDIGAPSGSAIVAAGAGRVISAGWRGGYGNTIIIDHGNGVTTLYAHQRSGGIKVSVGQHVKAGQRIGTVGSTGNSTGPHLHWEVRVNGTPKNPTTY